MPQTSFSETLALNLSRTSSFRKGQNYFKEGCVRKLWQKDDTFKALVQGEKTYEVSIRFVGEEVRTECTCPYDFGGACKHIVAAILAFAADPSFTVEQSQKESKKVEKLLSETSDNQRQIFLQKILTDHPHLIKSLEILLQGTKETAVTLSQYKARYKEVLSKLNLRQLLEDWYYEGEDYYDYSPYESGGGESLSDVVCSFVGEAKEYFKNKNFAECLKIYQAILEAMAEKEKTLEGEYADLSDLFCQEMEGVFSEYVKTLEAAKDEILIRVGIGHLLTLFEKDDDQIGQSRIFEGIKQVVKDKEQAKIALAAISWEKKEELSNPENSLLAYLYFLIKDFAAFEKISLKFLDQNPDLVLDLLNYYHRQGQKGKVLATASRVLQEVARRAKDNFPFGWQKDQTVEIEIRRFLKKVFDPKTDYVEMVGNLERLFLVTRSLADYKELTKVYRSRKEKEEFWEKMKKEFLKHEWVEPVFKVFRLEKQKKEILKLVLRYPEENCFPQMVASVREDFPKECFTVYKKKVEKMLEVAKVSVYSQVAYHLRQMQKIGLEKKFAGFVGWIKAEFYRRRRLLEELEKNQL